MASPQKSGARRLSHASKMQDMGCVRGHKDLRQAPGISDRTRLHSEQGASEVAAIVDCLPVDHCCKITEMLAAYIGLSRVKTKEGLLIASPFSPALFCHGQPPGPEILMKVLRREISADDAGKDDLCSSLPISCALCQQ